MTPQRFTFEVYRCPECGRTYDPIAAQGLAPMCCGPAGLRREFDGVTHEPAECELLTVATVLEGDCPKCGERMDEDEEDSCATCAGGAL